MVTAPTAGIKIRTWRVRPRSARGWGVIAGVVESMVQNACAALQVAVRAGRSLTCPPAASPSDHATTLGGVAVGLLLTNRRWRWGTTAAVPSSPAPLVPAPGVAAIGAITSLPTLTRPAQDRPRNHVHQRSPRARHTHSEPTSQAPTHFAQPNPATSHAGTGEVAHLRTDGGRSIITPPRAVEPAHGGAYRVERRHVVAGRPEGRQAARRALTRLRMRCSRRAISSGVCSSGSSSGNEGRRAPTGMMTEPSARMV